MCNHFTVTLEANLAPPWHAVFFPTSWPFYFLMVCFGKYWVFYFTSKLAELILQVRCKEMKRADLIVSSGGINREDIEAISGLSSAGVCYSIEVKDTILPPWVVCKICAAMSSDGRSYETRHAYYFVSLSYCENSNHLIVFLFCILSDWWFSVFTYLAAWQLIRLRSA